VRGILLALAVMVSAPFVRRFGGVETTTLSWSETRTFAEELEADEAVERAIFRREVVIVLLIAAVIAARIALV
jgi:hypothetical protein